jgi:hypothetical protein
MFDRIIYAVSLSSKPRLCSMKSACLHYFLDLHGKAHSGIRHDLHGKAHSGRRHHIFASCVLHA